MCFTPKRKILDTIDIRIRFTFPNVELIKGFSPFRVKLFNSLSHEIQNSLASFTKHKLKLYSPS